MSHQETIEREAVYHDRVARTFDINRPLVDRYLGLHSPADDGMVAELTRLNRCLFEGLGELKGARVLVYGCGNDCAALWFAKAGANVDAIDISPQSVDNQKQMAACAGLELNAYVMDAHHLEFASNEYDLVYGNAILHHLSVHRVVGEIYRVLKPGGRGVFRDVMKGNLFLQAFRYATPCWRTPDEKPLTGKDLSLFKRRFSVCRIDRFIFSGLPYFFFVRMMNDVCLKKTGLKWRIRISNTFSNLLDRLDFVVFRLLPFLKNQAWVCLIRLEK